MGETGFTILKGIIFIFGITYLIANGIPEKPQQSAAVIESVKSQNHTGATYNQTIILK
jgi:hypothetical protein